MLLISFFEVLLLLSLLDDSTIGSSVLFFEVNEKISLLLPSFSDISTEEQSFLKELFLDFFLESSS